MMRRKKILIIEDNGALAALLFETLLEMGFDVIAALDGDHGARLAKKARPDLILLDVNLPVKGGVSVFHEINETYQGDEKIPFFVITGNGSLEKKFEGLEVAGFMAKPFALEAFKQKIKDIMRARYGDFPEPEQKHNLKTSRLLVVESNVNVLDDLEKPLKNCNYRILHRKNEEAIRRSLKEDFPDMILIGLKGAEVNSREIQLSRAISESAKAAGVPILLYLPGEIPLAVDKTMSLCRAAGADYFFQYSTPLELLMELDYIFERKERNIA